MPHVCVWTIDGWCSGFISASREEGRLSFISIRVTWDSGRTRWTCLRGHLHACGIHWNHTIIYALPLCVTRFHWIQGVRNHTFKKKAHTLLRVIWKKKGPWADLCKTALVDRSWTACRVKINTMNAICKNPVSHLFIYFDLGSPVRRQTFRASGLQRHWMRKISSVVHLLGFSPKPGRSSSLRWSSATFFPALREKPGRHNRQTYVVFSTPGVFLQTRILFFRPSALTRSTSKSPTCSPHLTCRRGWWAGGQIPLRDFYVL